MTSTIRPHNEPSCAGCGVKLQTSAANAPGFVPDQAMDRQPLICQRCFRIKNYNEVSAVTVHPDDFLRLLNQVGRTDSLVVSIVDLFDFEGSIIGGLQRFAGTNPVVLVVNKVDLLPKVTNLNKLLNWVQKQAKENGLKPVEVVLCSARKNIGFERLIEVLNRCRKGKDIYVVGATNVGKSSLINRLIKDYSNLQAELTVSRYPGTTLDMVNIPLEDGRFIIDTPGIVYPFRMTELVDRADLHTIMPDKPLKPLVFQLDAEQTLFFGALARLDFAEGEHQSFTCFTSPSLKVHRTKLEKADELYAAHKGELLNPPSKERLAQLPALVKHQFRIPKGSAGTDILISGLGWIKVNSDRGALLNVHVPKGVKVVLRPSMI